MFDRPHRDDPSSQFIQIQSHILLMIILKASFLFHLSEESLIHRRQWMSH
jgi:hypothetical protein